MRALHDTEDVLAAMVEAGTTSRTLGGTICSRSFARYGFNITMAPLIVLFPLASDSTALGRLMLRLGFRVHDAALA